MVAKGETPIEKNIIVTDEQGNILEATWPKRAAGLVKKGRARFVGENTICLVRPPEIPEDNKMSDVNERNISEVTDREIFEQIVKIQNSLEQMEVTLNAIILTNSGAEVNIDCEDVELLNETALELLEKAAEIARTKTDAICDVFKEREKTLNKLLDFWISAIHDR